jgi:beta-N-acetylhexosaminidase
MSRQAMETAVAALPQCDEYVVAAFASAGAFRTIGLAGELPAFIESLTTGNKPVALIALGNPYLLRNFPNVAAYMATFSNVPTSEVSSVRAIFGEIPIRGHLPISIPGFAQLGDGIQVPARKPLQITGDLR